MRINSISLQEFNSSATVTLDEDIQFEVHIDYNEYSVVNSQGNRIECYRGLDEALDSDFFPAFMILADLNRRMTSFIPINVLRRISESKTSFHMEEGTAVALNEFIANGVERKAVIEKDADGDCRYEILDGDGRLMEIYGALFLALSSPYYPVLVELDKYLDKAIEEANEND